MTRAEPSRRLPRPLVLGAAALFVSALLLALAARYLLIEPPAIATACSSAPGQGWCPLRSLLVASFQFKQPGWAALVCGAIAWLVAPGKGGQSVPLSRTRIGSLFSLTALGLGAIGLVLYAFDPAAVGALLGVVALCRIATTSPSRPSLGSGTPLRPGPHHQ